MKVDFVVVRRRRLFRIKRRNETDDMRLHHAAGGSRDAQIAVLCVVAQSFRKIGVAMMADSEFLLRPKLLARR